MEKRLSRKGSGEGRGRRLGEWGKKKIPETVLDAEGNVQYRCEVCSKLFNKNYNLRAHSRLHTGERPFKCTASGCGKSFLWKSSLTSHLATHEKDGRQTSRMKSAIQEGERVAMVTPQDEIADPEFEPPCFPFHAGELQTRRLDRSRSMPLDSYSPNFRSTEWCAPSLTKTNSEAVPDHMTFSPAFAEHNAYQFEGGSFAAPSPAFQPGDKRVHPNEFQRSNSSPKRLASGNSFETNDLRRSDSSRDSLQTSHLPSHSISATLLELEEIIKPSLQAHLSPRHAQRSGEQGIATTEMGTPYGLAGSSVVHEFRQSPLVGNIQHVGPSARPDTTGSFRERRSDPWIEAGCFGASNPVVSQLVRNECLDGASTQSLSQPCSGRMPPRLPRSQLSNDARRAPSLNIDDVLQTQHRHGETEGLNMMLSPVLDPPSRNSLSPGPNTLSHSAPLSAPTSSLGNALNTLESLELEHLSSALCHNGTMGQPPSNVTPTFNAGVLQPQTELKQTNSGLRPPQAPGDSFGLAGGIDAGIGAGGGVFAGRATGVGGGGAGTGLCPGSGPGFTFLADIFSRGGAGVEPKEIPIFSPTRTSPTSRDVL